MSIIRINGKFIGPGRIEFETKSVIHWSELSGKPVPQLPLGSSVEITIAYDENEFISGRNGIVWATYDFREAEIIRNALLTLQINTEIIKMIHPANTDVFLMRATNEEEIGEAVDFIWKSDSGLKLSPDWSYPEGEINKSFDQWLSGQ